ncbi:MAG: sugar phosphate isomerase/epimerase family protein [Chloroflexota bacterium]
MDLSFLPDEATPDFEAGLRLGAELGLRYAEVRLVDGVNVLDLTDDQIQRARQLLDSYGMAVSAIATPFFKCAIPGREPQLAGPLHGAKELSYDDHLDLLARGIEIAQAFDAPSMRIFSFWKEEGVDFWPAVEEAVAVTLESADGSGVMPCLENEGACCIGTSADMAEAAQRLTNTNLKFIWDPGNSSYCGMPPRAEDFAHFANRIALVHLKDVAYNHDSGEPQSKLIGEGDTDFHAELQRLAAAGYDGRLTLEPHHCPGGDCVAGMRASVEAIRGIAAEVNRPFS